MFEIIFRPVRRGPFEGSFILVVNVPPDAEDSAVAPLHPTVTTQSSDFMSMESRSDVEPLPVVRIKPDAILESSEDMQGGDHKKRKRDLQQELPNQRCLLQVVVTAKVTTHSDGRVSLY